MLKPFNMWLDLRGTNVRFFINMFFIILTLLHIYQLFISSSQIELHCAGVIPRTIEFSTIQDLFRGCDGGSLMYVAKDLLDGNGLTENSKVFLTFWPPGLSLVHTLYLSIFSEFISVTNFLSVLYSILTFSLFIILYTLNKYFLYKLIVFIAFNFLLISSPFQGWFSNSGLFYQEFLGIYFLLLAFITISIIETKNLKIKYYIIPGLMIGIACYFRATFETFSNLILVFIFCMSILQIFFLFNTLKFKVLDNRITLIKTVMIYLGISLFTFPWRLVNFFIIRPNEFSWTSYPNFWVMRWLPSEQLINQGLGPWVDGGYNLGCQLDPSKCLNIFKIESRLGAPYSGEGYLSNSTALWELTQSLFNYPLRFIYQRSLILYNHWRTDNFYNYLEKPNNLESFIFFAILLLSLVVCFYVLMFYKNAKSLVYILWFIFVFSTLAPLLIFHVEARYLINLKIGGIIIILIYLSKNLQGLVKNVLKI